MKTTIKIFLIITIVITGMSCNSYKTETFKVKETYKSDDLIITQITKNCFEHTSYKKTKDYGNVPCNGLIVKDNNEVIIFDTPTNNKTAEELIKWINENLHSKIKAIIPTHFHDDCLGGLEVFHLKGIPSYSYFKTIELAKENHLEVPKYSFKDSINLKVGSEKIVARFFGEGHTKDNVVGYFPKEKIIFGGCLIKALDASKGYLGDANTNEWSNTVEKLKKEYPNAKIIVPGHGEFGNRKLLDYTIGLFKIK